MEFFARPLEQMIEIFQLRNLRNCPIFPKIISNNVIGSCYSFPMSDLEIEIQSHDYDLFVDYLREQEMLPCFTPEDVQTFIETGGF